jgi:hypothetical protein
MRRLTVRILALALLAAPSVGCSSAGGNKDAGAGGTLADAAQPDVLPSADTPLQGDAKPLGMSDVGMDNAVADVQPDVPSPSDIQDDSNPLAAEDARPDSADDSDTDGPPPTIEKPQAIPARQQVTFRLTNGTSAPRYLGVQGNFYCAAFGISQGSTSLTMAMGYQCGCECPPPPGPHIANYWVISPQQTKDVVWDARALTSYVAYSDSCARSGSPSMSVSIIAAVWQPVGPGTYKVTLTLDSALPTNCTTADEIVTCPWPSAGGFGGNGGGICPSGATVAASFDLPDSGDIIVPIAL